MPNPSLVLRQVGWRSFALLTFRVVSFVNVLITPVVSERCRCDESTSCDDLMRERHESGNCSPVGWCLCAHDFGSPWLAVPVSVSKRFFGLRLTRDERWMHHWFLTKASSRICCCATDIYRGHDVT
ncbi:hypothetical protein PAXRUDRAFT_569306 [Paxillus rubicundulus Ve08.2h10]|uniref:Uncharacterized protein n=1 Tax=Paxillus rubicundulus Ve08.2h10 TaxID=930991 RepID=A0A0D0DVV8_9AGAM|nr:hypothetical protein PAXRUDRAFT_569306 [Paxillus rubicundulus Ve08.2h10]